MAFTGKFYPKIQTNITHCVFCGSTDLIIVQSEEKHHLQHVDCNCCNICFSVDCDAKAQLLSTETVDN